MTDHPFQRDVVAAEALVVTNTADGDPLFGQDA
jgi:hypothetical protein